MTHLSSRAFVLTTMLLCIHGRALAQASVAPPVPVPVQVPVPDPAHAPHPGPVNLEAAAPARVSLGGTPAPLDALLRYADAHAPAILVRSAEVSLADGESAAAAQWLPSNPTLQLSLGQRRAQGGAGRSPEAQVQLLQPIEIAGQRRHRRAVAESTRHTRESTLLQARWQVHQALHAGYRDALVLRDRASLARRLAEFAEQLLDVAQRRAAVADIAPLIVHIAEAEALQAQQRAVAALQVYRNACLHLAELSGWPPSSLPEPVGALPTPRRAPPLDELVAMALEHNVELAVRAAELGEANARVDLAAREAFPTPSLGLQYNYEGTPTAGNGEHVVMGVLQMPLPLFARNQEERAHRAAERVVALARQDATLAVLSARLERLRTTVDTGAARVAAFGADVLPRFEENLRLLRESFALGEIDILRVTLALERFLGVQQQALEAYADYFAAVAELELQVGHEIWPDGEGGEHADTK